MNRLKEYFSIKDLENLSGIKAHTLRVWEKRYNLLAPNRTDTNIRYYSLSHLQKLLNIVLLYKNGYKISRIARFAEEKIPLLVREIASRKAVKHHYLNDFKLAMLHFDRALFSETYNRLTAGKSFRRVFHEIFIPLLNELGMLWQTDTITPAHEHFITDLIKQKIIVNIENLPTLPRQYTGKTFVLYLPEEEMHEIGLLYVHYELMLRKCHGIYLGQAVPISGLKSIQLRYPEVTFISYFTVEPNKNKIDAYIEDFEKQIDVSPPNALWLLGRQTAHLTRIPSFVRTFKGIDQLLKTL